MQLLTNIMEQPDLTSLQSSTSNEAKYLKTYIERNCGNENREMSIICTVYTLFELSNRTIFSLKQKTASSLLLMTCASNRS